MAGIALSPGVLGASISVQDSTALAAYPVTGITLGTVAYVVSVGAKFTLKLSSDALVTDQVVAVSGVTGARWIREASAAVMTVTGPAVNTTDPLNPVVSVLASATATGLQSTYGYIVRPNNAPNLTDADATIAPDADKASLYVLPAGVLTANRALTLSDVTVGGTVIYVLVRSQSFTYEVKDAAGGSMITIQASTQARSFAFYCATGQHFTYSSNFYCVN